MASTKDLKTILFEKTAETVEKYMDTKDEVDRRVFMAMYDLIVDAGLEDEYIEYRKGGK